MRRKVKKTWTEHNKTKRKVVGPPRSKRESTRSERKEKKEYNWAKEKRNKMDGLPLQLLEKREPPI